MFKSILVPVDFSAPSRAAFVYALRMAECFGAEVRLLHVIEDSTSPDFESFPLSLSENALIASATKKLVRFSQSGNHPIAFVFPDVRIGIPWEVIVSVAEKGKTDLIVLPTHGRSGWKHLLMGSVAEKVIRNAPCPVLVLRKPQPDQSARRKTARHSTELPA